MKQDTGATKKGKTGSEELKDYINRLVMPAFEKALHETGDNRLSVGGGSVLGTRKLFYQPHNFRRYFDFSRVGFDPANRPPKVGCNHRIVNKSEHFFEFDDFSVRVKKRQILVHNRVEHKRWFVIPVSEAGATEILRIEGVRESECAAFLRSFISWFGGSSRGEVLGRFMEPKFQHEDSLEGIPGGMRFHADLVKKVYGDPNVEFKDSASAVNFLQNRAVESVLPALHARLKRFSEQINALEDVPALREKAREGWRLALRVVDLWIASVESGRVRVR